jgi:uncharacterized protein
MRKFYEIGFTPSVMAEQRKRGSRDHYAKDSSANIVLTDREASFIAARDGFFLATVNEDGWPYIQFRGGPAGFVRHVGDNNLRFADYRGNYQYMSVGNATESARCSLFFMDYAAGRRLKAFGLLRFEDVEDTAELRAQLGLGDYKAVIERVAEIEIIAFDWNCAQHIPQRMTAEEFNRFLGGIS